jgi:hypothetical protein
MMRRDTANQDLEIAAKTATAPVRGIWMFSFAILGIILIHLLVPRSASAEATALDPRAIVSVALLAVHLDLPVAPPARDPMRELLIVPQGTLYLTDAELADESISTMVERGTNADLIRRSNFRKKSMDLFRTDGVVEIARREMLVRLRVRAKARRAMSVEVKF